MESSAPWSNLQLAPLAQLGRLLGVQGDKVGVSRELGGGRAPGDLLLELGEAVQGKGEELDGLAGAVLELHDAVQGAPEVRGEGRGGRVKGESGFRRWQPRLIGVFPADCVFPGRRTTSYAEQARKGLTS